MKNLGYYNGKIDELENMSIPMLDRVSFFGDGVYDATYSRNYKILDLDEHLDRFFTSAKLLNINIKESKEELKELLNLLVKKMDTDDNFVYWQVTRGTGIRTHEYSSQNQAGNLWVNIFHKEILDVNKQVKVITMDDTRHLHCNIKTLNLIPAVMASQKAKELGCFETIFHRNNRVTECAHSNVSIIKDNRFITPPTDNLILAGITRKKLLEQCEKLGIEHEEKPFYINDLLTADEIIISSAGALCIQVVEIDGKKVGGKSPIILNKLKKAMLDDFYTKTDI